MLLPIPKIFSLERLNVNIIFSLMILASALMTFLFFKSWNPSPEKRTNLPAEQLKKFSVDSCAFGRHDITVIGWAFIEGNERILNRVYAQLNDREWVEIRTSTINREDVVSILNLSSAYARSGFKAARRSSSSSEEFTKTIMITSVDSKGNEHAEKYICK